MSEHSPNHRCIDPKRHPRIAALFPGVILPEQVFDAFEKRLAEDEDLLRVVEFHSALHEALKITKKKS